MTFGTNGWIRMKLAVKRELNYPLELLNRKKSLFFSASRILLTIFFPSLFPIYTNIQSFRIYSMQSIWNKLWLLKIQVENFPFFSCVTAISTMNACRHFSINTTATCCKWILCGFSLWLFVTTHTHKKLHE